MAIMITEDGVVNYENSPDVNRKLFPNLNVCGKEIDKLEEEINGKAPAVFSSATGSIATFDNGADDMPMKSCVVNIEPIQEGSGDPSPDNVRPISGRTGLSVTRSGKNLLLKARQSSTMNGITWTLNDDGSITASGTSTGRSYIRIIVFTRDAYTLPNGTYTYSLTPTGSDYTNIYSLIGAYKGNKYYKNVCAVGRSNNFANVFEWNDSDLAAVLDISVEVGQENKTVNCTVYPQIELGSLASSYEEYQGETYDIEFPTEAGTVYGAKLDVTKGELVVDHVLYAVNDKTIIARQPGKTDYYFNVVIGDLLSGSEINTGIISNILKSTPFAGASGIWGGNDGCCLRAGGFTFFTDATKNMDINAAKQWLINNEAEIYYPIATPITYQLTPQEIHTLLGENNIWSGAGDISVDYPADTKTYIDDLSIKTVEVTGQTPTITAEENTRYICGEVTSLSFTPSEKGICDVRFTAASISTVLTLPETVKLPGWFDPTLLEANTTYEINIVDGVYGVVMSWA